LAKTRNRIDVLREPGPNDPFGTMPEKFERRMRQPPRGWLSEAGLKFWARANGIAADVQLEHTELYLRQEELLRLLRAVYGAHEYVDALAHRTDPAHQYVVVAAKA
jgi:hypothetical protein